MTLILVLSSTILSAQHTYKFKDSLGTYEVKFTPADPDTKFAPSPTKPLAPKTHELRLSTSWGATDWGGWTLYNQEINYLGSAHKMGSYYMGPTHYYTLSGDYGYWVTEWFNIGSSFTWVAGCRNIFDNVTQQRIKTLHNFHFRLYDDITNQTPKKRSMAKSSVSVWSLSSPMATERATASRGCM